ncbi:MAG: hypothetical protein E7665_05035 [Ruminococcaceae bacterium]|nr:hypothetical protein [Oscillospiraceae bacterium]
MKKRIILLAAILSVLTLFTSCVRIAPIDTQISTSKETHETTEESTQEQSAVPEFTIAWKCYSIYENYIFADVKGSIKYQKLDNIQKGGFSISDDTISSQNSINGFGGAGAMFLVDPEETRKNNGVPVLIISQRYVYKDSVTNKIVSSFSIHIFNTATQKVQNVKTNIQETIVHLYSYGDIIFYLTDEADKGLVIHRINKDGSGYKKMESDIPHRYRIATVHDEKFYFYADDLKSLYRCDLDFSNTEELFEIGYDLAPFVSNEYIYYSKVHGTIELNNRTQQNLYIYRRKISELETSEELILKSVIGVRVSGDIILYYSYEDMKDDNSNIPRCHILHAYNSLESKDMGVIYRNEDSDTVKKCDVFSGNYACGYYFSLDKKTGNYNHDNSKTFLLNIETGEETIIQW